MSEGFEFQKLVDLCAQAHQELQSRAIRTVDTYLVIRNWLIGYYIVEFEQRGEDRAQYGNNLIGNLAKALKTKSLKGTSSTSLKQFRSFYLAYKGMGQTVSGLFLPIDPQGQKGQTVSDLSLAPFISQNRREISAFSETLLKQVSLGWSHYVILLTLDNGDERRFYEIEAAANSWSVRELERQVASSLYERLSLSRDKEEIRRLAEQGLVVEKAADIIKNPLVLEFLGLEEKSTYSENELESAIIEKLETFLLELGKGFLFEARQRRFTFDNDHFYVDLVFYNRLLQCYVLIDLKREKLTHQDLGQMQMYVNYFDRHVKTEKELPTIGIVLCHRKNDAVVELTLPKNANIFASKYQLYLPSKEELKRKLENIEAELEARNG
ncbi:MAG: PDDEXK nuclease domain-containing protein [Fibrobacterota bacterium]|nr:PDDEXK nuclease domain-containing protein [Fibrobacterota bacterium]